MKKQILPDSPYVYSLSDDEGNVFYIGKGRKRRMYAHEQEAIRGKKSDKHDRIRKILESGGSIQYEILGIFATDREAADAEVKLIAEHDGLLNKTKGGEIGGLVVQPIEQLRRRARSILTKIELCGHKDHPLTNLIRREAENPSPNMVSWHPDTGIVFGWHADRPLIQTELR